MANQYTLSSSLSARERFEAKIGAIRSGCWMWSGRPGSHGYGQFNVGGKRGLLVGLAHHWAWLFYRGAIPAGADLHHQCENKLCVNPWHLRPLRRPDHARKHAAGVKTGARQRAKTHCRNGHPYSGENLYTYPNGERACRTCQRASSRAHYHRAKGGPDASQS